MSAVVACIRCGSPDRIVGAFFRDPSNHPTAAIACHFCGVGWPVAMTDKFASEYPAIMRVDGVPSVVDAR